MARQANHKGREKEPNNLKLFRLIQDIEAEDNVADLASLGENWDYTHHLKNGNRDGDEHGENEFEEELMLKQEYDLLQDEGTRQINLNAFCSENNEAIEELESNCKDDYTSAMANTTGRTRHQMWESDESEDSLVDGDLQDLADAHKINRTRKPSPRRKYTTGKMMEDVEDKIDSLNLEERKRKSKSKGKPECHINCLNLERKRINIGEPEYICELCSVTPHDHTFRPITDDGRDELDNDEGDPDLYCELCLEETRVVGASSYCVDCQLYLCASCRRYHWKILATRSHLIISQQEMLTRVYDKYMPGPETETPQEILQNHSKVPDHPHTNRDLVNVGRYADDNIAMGNSCCGPCLYEGSKVEGTNFCYDCVEYLCRECRVQHDMLAPTSRHDVVNRTRMAGNFYNLVPTVDPNTDYEGLFYGPESRRDGPTYKPPDNKLSHTKGIGAQTNQDVNTVFITGSSFFSDGKLILADHNNCRVKLYDPKYNLVSHLELSDNIADVVVVRPDEVAVTTPNRKQIVFVHVDGGCKLKKHRTVPTVGKYWGIDFKHEELYAICVGTNQVSTSVHIMTIAGQLLNIVIPIDDASIEPVLKSAQYLTVSPTGGTIYIGDSDKGVVAFGMDGRVIFHIQDVAMAGVKGLAVDSRNIYVCSSSSNCLYQVGYDGTCMKRILSMHDSMYVDAPHTVSIDPAGRQLLVSMQKSDVVHIFAFG